eukprot:1159650-Pelagomonas_calceolata.AAC.9
MYGSSVCMQQHRLRACVQRFTGSQEGAISQAHDEPSTLLKSILPFRAATYFYDQPNNPTILFPVLVQSIFLSVLAHTSTSSHMESGELLKESTALQGCP